MAEHFVEPEELQAYLDRELKPARQAEVERHIQECQECSKLVTDLRHVSATLQRWQVEPAPSTLRPPIIVEPKSQSRWSWARVALGLSGAAAVVLILVAISIPNLLRSRMATVTLGPSDEQPSPMYLQVAPGGGDAKAPESQSGATRATVGRMITYEATMTIQVKDFDAAKTKLQSIVAEVGGYLAESKSADTPGQPRRMGLTIRLPVEKLFPALGRMRGLGRVVNEQLSTEEVTDQVVDLEARLRNACATEQRLIAVLNKRTGKVSDILEVEREIARTRQEIERMEAQRQNLLNRVELATVQVTLAEEFKAELMPAPVGTGTRLRNAVVDGYENFLASFLGLVVFLARYGLTLLFWLVLGWLTWRGIRRGLVGHRRLS